MMPQEAGPVSFDSIILGIVRMKISEQDQNLSRTGDSGAHHVFCVAFLSAQINHDAAGSRTREF